MLSLILAAGLIAFLWFGFPRIIEYKDRRMLYGWGEPSPTFERSGNSIFSVSPRLLINNAHEEAKRLIQCGELCGFDKEELQNLFERYLKALESAKEGSYYDASESKQCLEEFSEHAHKIALQKKRDNFEHGYQKIELWRARLSTWSDAVSRLVPELVKKDPKVRTATA